MLVIVIFKHHVMTSFQVSSSADCILKVSGLVPDKNYVAAVAAYTEEGKLIGGSIGHTGRPIVAACPLSLLLVYGYLARVREIS